MKRFAAALTVTTALLAFLPVPITAQTQAPASATASQTDYEALGPDAETVRDRFREVLSRYPRNVGRVLRMDPALFQNAAYMSGYPGIAQFVAEHPEVARNPEFYLEGYGIGYDSPQYAETRAIETFGNFLEGMLIVLTIGGITLGLLWLIKSTVEHRRWLRMSKTQTEVHTKLLDRFSSSEELLEYMKTPAGARFLESAPISVALEGGRPSPVSAPLNRIIWSLQAGVILMLAGLGILFGRNQIAIEDIRTMLYLIGVFGMATGVGFVLSAAASYGLSRRLGLISEGTSALPRPSVTAGRGE